MIGDNRLRRRGGFVKKPYRRLADYITEGSTLLTKQFKNDRYV
jgi:hypothetical protein